MVTEELGKGLEVDPGRSREESALGVEEAGTKDVD